MFFEWLFILYDDLRQIVRNVLNFVCWNSPISTEIFAHGSVFYLKTGTFIGFYGFWYSNQDISALTRIKKNWKVSMKCSNSKQRVDTDI